MTTKSMLTHAVFMRCLIVSGVSPESKMTAHVDDKRQISKLILPAMAIQSVSSGGPAREHVANGSAWRNALPPSKAPFSCRQYREKSNPHH